MDCGGGRAKDNIPHTLQILQMASYALRPYQCPSGLPTIHQRSPGEPTGCLRGRIHRRYPNLFGLRRPAPGPHMRSAQMPSESWTIRKPQEVQLPHGYSRVPRVHTDSNRTPHGPGEGSHDPELAGTVKRL